MNSNYIQITESVIDLLTQILDSPNEDDLHLADLREIWAFNGNIENANLLLGTKKECKIILSGQLNEKPVPARRIRNIAFDTLKSFMSWELHVASQTYAPDALYCRFATTGKGKRGNILYTGIFRIDGPYYTQWYLSDSKKISGKTNTEVSLYHNLCHGQ